MSIPEFDRAEYPNALPPSPYTDALPPSPYTAPAPPPSVQTSPYADPFASTQSYFAKAILFGAAAALIGALGYALIGLSGWMVSIVAIGIGWLIAKAMMTATLGTGGRKFQVAAVVLTYFAVSTGQALGLVWLSRTHTIPYLPVAAVLTALGGPFLALESPFNGAIGLLILFIGMRTAWRLAAGSPGFGNNTPTQRLTPFG